MTAAAPPAPGSIATRSAASTAASDCFLAIGAALLGFDAGPVRAGHGVGVIAQGGFLLLFDAWHAARLTRPVMSR